MVGGPEINGRARVLPAYPNGNYAALSEVHDHDHHAVTVPVIGPTNEGLDLGLFSRRPVLTVLHRDYGSDHTIRQSHLG